MVIVVLKHVKHVSTIFIGTANEPHCMNCKKSWSQEFMVRSLIDHLLQVIIRRIEHNSYTNAKLANYLKQCSVEDFGIRKKEKMAKCSAMNWKNLN